MGDYRQSRDADIPVEEAVDQLQSWNFTFSCVLQHRQSPLGKGIRFCLLMLFS